METKERIVEFLIDPSSNVLLLEGAWGVGKTFVVNEAIKEYKKNKKRIKLINFSLFGVSDVKEANQKLIIASKFSQKLFKKMSEVGFATSYSDVTGNTISFEVNGVFQALMEEEYKEKIFSQAIIVIDDIERKDRKVSIIELMGFIDSLKLKKTKIILIANSLNLCSDEEKKDFLGFKEKIVDYEIRMQKPTVEAFKKLIVDNSIDYEYCNNLRTIQKYNSMKNRYLKDDDKLKNQIVFSALNIIDNLKTDKKGFVSKKVIEELYSLSQRQQTEKSAEELDEFEKQMYEKYENYSDKDIFLYNIENNDKYNIIQRYSLSTSAKEIFEIVETCDYSRLVNVKLKYEQSPKARYPRDFYDFYLDYDEVKSINSYLGSLKDNINSNKYDIMSMTTAYCDLKLQFLDIFKKKIDNDLIDSIEELLFNKTVSTYLENDYSYEHSCFFDFSDFVDSVDKRKELDVLCYKLFSTMYTEIARMNDYPLCKGYCDKLKHLMERIEVIKDKLHYKCDINVEWFKKLINNRLKEIFEYLLSKRNLESWEWHQSLNFVDILINILKCENYVKDSFLKIYEKNPNNERIFRFLKYFKFIN